MKGLVFYGAKCDCTIWHRVQEQLKPYALTYVSYPHDVLEAAASPEDIVKWVAERYGKEGVDVLIGHSMGGQVILKSLPYFRKKPGKIILIESNPVPSGPMYQNLMTQENMERYGDFIREMFQKEAVHYSEELLLSLRSGFDLLGNIREYSGEIYSIYGDRGQAVSKRHYEELLLPKDILEKMQISFVHNACHMPMIEHPAELSGLLIQILDQAECHGMGKPTQIDCFSHMGT